MKTVKNKINSELAYIIHAIQERYFEFSNFSVIYNETHQELKDILYKIKDRPYLTWESIVTIKDLNNNTFNHYHLIVKNESDDRRYTTKGSMSFTIIPVERVGNTFIYSEDKSYSSYLAEDIDCGFKQFVKGKKKAFTFNNFKEFSSYLLINSQSIEALYNKANLYPCLQPLNKGRIKVNYRRLKPYLEEQCIGRHEKDLDKELYKWFGSMEYGDSLVKLSHLRQYSFSSNEAAFITSVKDKPVYYKKMYLGDHYYGLGIMIADNFFNPYTNNHFYKRVGLVYRSVAGGDWVLLSLYAFNIKDNTAELISDIFAFKLSLDGLFIEEDNGCSLNEMLEHYYTRNPAYRLNNGKSNSNGPVDLLTKVEHTNNVGSFTYTKLFPYMEALRSRVKGFYLNMDKSITDLCEERTKTYRRFRDRSLQLRFE